MQRVVVTGMGAITPVGNSVAEMWKNVTAGRHGIGPVTGIDMTGQKVTLAAQVKDFDIEQYIGKKEARRMDPYARFAFAAARQAIENCGSDFSADDPFRVGVLIGSGIGGLQSIETDFTKYLQKGAGRVPPLTVPMMIINMAAGEIAIRYGFKGVNFSAVSACASGSQAVGEAMHMIRHGYADVMIAGGGEAAVTPFSLAAFSNMTALCLSTDPDRASIPFDRERSGFVMGEGAGALVLESLEHAKARGAKIYGEIAGYGATCDAYHITSPDPEAKGAEKAMEFAVRDAGVSLGDIGYINAHGTSTPPNDRSETAAIRALFGADADRLMVSSTKSMTGHMLGAAGAVEAIITTLALREGLVPPTANYREKDPDCDLDYVPEGARRADIKAAISNTFGFGGHNASLCIRRYDE